jgi:putative tryptophan/tyrosine transport system substrate-binding protein
VIRHKALICVVFILCHAAGFLPKAAGANTLSCRGGILISKEIRPYMQVVESFEKNMALPVCRAFLDSDGQIKSLDFPVARLGSTDRDFFVAVGPDALAYLAAEPRPYPVFHALVLEPDRITSGSDPFCGVTFNLFTADRIRRFKQILPGLTRLAVMYNPDSNRIIADVLAQFSNVEGVRAVPVAVTSQTGISRALETVVKQADAVYFIPDRTVISAAIVKHIIEYGLARGIPSIGYNRFFHESGSILSLEVDYDAVGRQVADMVSGFQEQGECLSRDPEAEILYNEKVAKHLKMEIQKQFLQK